MTKPTFPREFEFAVLSCLVQDAKFMRESLAVLRPEHFQDGMHRSACEVIATHYQRANELPSKPGLLSALVEAERRRIRAKKANDEAIIVEPCSQFVEKLFQPLGEMADVKRRWLDFCKTRELENVLLEQQDNLTNGRSSPAEVVETIRRTYQRLVSTEQGGSNFFDPNHLIALPQELVEMRQRTFTTGFTGLDDKMGGGATPGTLTTFVAGPKSGKSMTLLNVGYYNLSQPKRTVVHFTCEISERKCKKRYFSRISGINYNLLNDPTMINLALERCFEFWERTQSKLWVKGYPASTANCDAFRSYLYWLEANHGVKADVVVIDYVDEVLPIEKKGEVRHDLGQVCKEMRVLAEEFNVPVFTATQGNRESLSKSVIRMQDVAESIQKVAVSDHIISICKTDTEDQEKRGRFFFAGSREAETGGIVHFRFDWATCMMAEIKDLAAFVT